MIEKVRVFWFRHVEIDAFIDFHRLSSTFIDFCRTCRHRHAASIGSKDSQENTTNNRKLPVSAKVAVTVKDGLSNTLMMCENVVTGSDASRPEINWATGDGRQSRISFSHTICRDNIS